MNGLPTTDRFDRACGDVGQLPGTKADEAHLMPLCDLFLDGFRESVNHRVRLFQVDMSLGCDEMTEFLFSNDLHRF